MNARQDRVGSVLQEEDEQDGVGVRRKRARKLVVDLTKARPQSHGGGQGSESVKVAFFKSQIKRSETAIFSKTLHVVKVLIKTQINL